METTRRLMLGTTAVGAMGLLARTLTARAQGTPGASGGGGPAASTAGMISAADMARQGRRPAILHFRPTHFKQVSTPEGLKRWEQLVLDCTGIHVSSIYGNAYYETFCGGNGDADDCAEEDPGEQHVP